MSQVALVPSAPNPQVVTFPEGLQVSVSAHSAFIGLKPDESDFNILRQFRLAVEAVKELDASMIVNRTEFGQPRLIRLNLRR